MGYKHKSFFAYSDFNREVGETIETAINKINNGRKELFVESWKSLSKDGRLVITKILQAINDCDFFFCDLTNLSYNVLFELGYAVSMKKKIVIFRDSKNNAYDATYRAFRFILSITYNNYQNSDDICNVIEQLDMNEKYDCDYVEKYIGQNQLSTKEKSLLYLKSTLNSDASVKLNKYLEQYKQNLVCDDPGETRSNSFPWYIQNVMNSFCMVAHFVGDTSQDAHLHNAKLSFLTGCSNGLGVPTLMLAHDPFEAPLDYANNLSIHQTASECEKIFKEWFDVNREFIDSQRKRIPNSDIVARNELSLINLGDPIAENDATAIDDYFICTSAYEEAFKSSHVVFVGRKGCGKTANLIKLSKDMVTYNSLAFVIKPVSYQLEGILEYLEQIEKKAERGYLVESIWKFLIYTEIINKLYNDIISKPTHYQLSSSEQSLVDFVNDREESILLDFSSRLEATIKKLSELNSDANSTKVSELLHINLLGDIRRLVGNVLNGKKSIALLIDNLDKSWNPNVMNISLVSEFILGIIDVSSSVIYDFAKSSSRENPTELKIHIFLRDDIYHRIQKFSNEKDKIPVCKISWTDRDTLFSIIETRIASGKSINIWNKYFCNSIDGILCKDYMHNYLIPKPRDIIILVKSALQYAINRKHSLIEEDDIASAVIEYSQRAIDALVVELSSDINDAEELLFQFLGSKTILTESMIREIISSQNHDYESVTDSLCYMSFLGYEIREGVFEYVYDEDEYRKLRSFSDVYLKKSSLNEKRYRIHPAFWSYLECEPDN